MLTSQQQYRYLGKHFGLDSRPDSKQYFHKIMEEKRLPGVSLLAPWQELEALEMFILWKLNYLMRLVEISPDAYDLFEKMVVARTTCTLKQRASHYLQMVCRREAGFGILPLQDRHAIADVAQCCGLTNGGTGGIHWHSISSYTPDWQTES